MAVQRGCFHPRSIIHSAVFFCVVSAFHADALALQKAPAAQTEPMAAANTVVIARVAGRAITLKDFLERAEYTIRPSYCKGSSANDKNIILNTLVTEKILAAEAGRDNELLKNERFRNFITGRRDQKMLDLLYSLEGVQKVTLDSAEVANAFMVAGRTYKVRYFTLRGREAAAFVAAPESPEKDSVIEAVFKNIPPSDTVLHREINWASAEAPPIHQALFSSPLKKGALIGPIAIDDSTALCMKVDGWNDRVALSEQAVRTRYNDVEEALRRQKADSAYDAFVLKVMDKKEVKFDAGALNALTKAIVPFYTSHKGKKETEFLELTYRREAERPQQLAGNEYDAIKDRALLSIDGKIWTVGDLKKEMDKHPLVFRKSRPTDKFAPQLRLAIVDLIRDKYLAEEAYKRGLAKSAIVAHYEQTWEDAGLALFERDRILKQSNVELDGSVQTLARLLNPRVKELLKKYSDSIEINVEAYDRIALTKTDMMVIQHAVPYPVYVPSFPQMITYNRLNYGRKMPAQRMNHL